jgi:predicted ATP-dependent serine protease
MKSIIYLLERILQNSTHSKIISISGESGSGKTTLALQLAAYFLSKSRSSSCLWIQASELFPHRRLKSLYQKDSMNSNILEKNIFVTPSHHTFRSYEEQSKFIINLIKSMVLPPHLKSLVIDNISHHLRYEISNYSEISQITNLLDRFFEEQLFPLICFCQRENIYLLLIHESSYDPTLGKNRAFYSKLYDRINTISIVFNPSVIKYLKTGL